MTIPDSVLRVRSWLEGNLFPEAPPPAARSGSRRALVMVGIAIVLVAVQMARMWPSAPLNSLWEEDGELWLPDAMHHGVLENLTTPYNGYLQTLSRLIAEPVSRLPVTWFAPAMAVCGSAVVAGCAMLVWNATAPHLEHKHVRTALAAMVVLLPVVGVETLGTLTNSMWFLFFVTFWLLLWRPATTVGAAGVAGLAFLAAVSNAGVALLAPLWLLRLIAVRDRRDAMILAAFAGGVIVQFGYSWGDLNRLGEASTYSIFPVVYRPVWHWVLLPAYAQRIIGGALGGDRISGYLWRHIGVPFEIALGTVLIAFVVVVIARRRTRTRVLALMSVVVSLATFLVSAYERWSAFVGDRHLNAAGSQFPWPPGGSDSLQAHYMVVPTLLLITAVLVMLDAEHRLARPRIGAILVLLIVALVSFDVGNPNVRGVPTWSQALRTARAVCLGRPVTSVQVTIAPRGWSMPLACTNFSIERRSTPPRRS